MNDSLFNEVDADVRAERITQLWMRHRMHLLLIVIALIVGTAANVLWQNYQEKRGGELFQRFTDAQTLYDQGKQADAAVAFGAITEHAHGDILTLAEIWEARALAASGDKAKAITVLTHAVQDSTGLWSDLACLRLVSLDSEATTCLANKKDSPLANQRHEWQAANAWAAGRHAEAITLLEQLLTSADTSDATRARIDGWLATMRAEKAAQ